MSSELHNKNDGRDMCLSKCVYDVPKNYLTQAIDLTRRVDVLDVLCCIFVICGPEAALAPPRVRFHEPQARDCSYGMHTDNVPCKAKGIRRR